MVNQYGTHPSHEAGGHLIYLACSHEDLIAVEIDTWNSGFTEVGKVETSAEPTSMPLIEQAAETACDQALKVYIPLDLDRFRDVFTRAWCAGYCTSLSRTQQHQHPIRPEDSSH